MRRTPERPARPGRSVESGAPGRTSAIPGRVYVDKRCGDCHGLGEAVDEEAEDLLGPALAPITGDQPVERIAEKMWNHVPEMSRKMGQQRIPWPRFEARELADMLAFLTGGWDETGTAAGGSP